MALLDGITDFLFKNAAGLGGLIDTITYIFNLLMVIGGFLLVQLFIFGPIVLLVIGAIKFNGYLKDSDIIPRARAGIDSLRERLG